VTSVGTSATRRRPRPTGGCRKASPQRATAECEGWNGVAVDTIWTRGNGFLARLGFSIAAGLLSDASLRQQASARRHPRFCGLTNQVMSGFCWLLKIVWFILRFFRASSELGVLKMELASSPAEQHSCLPN